MEGSSLAISPAKSVFRDREGFKKKLKTPQVEGVGLGARAYPNGLIYM